MPVMGGDPAGGVVVALLGSVEVGPAGGVMAPVAQSRLRVLLGLLGVTEGRVVTAEALVDGLWGEEWSPGRERNLHALVYQLRRRLAALEPGKGGTRLARAGAGYRLTLGPGELDVAVFRDLARLAQNPGTPRRPSPAQHKPVPGPGPGQPRPALPGSARPGTAAGTPARADSRSRPGDRSLPHSPATARLSSYYPTLGHPRPPGTPAPRLRLGRRPAPPRPTSTEGKATTTPPAGSPPITGIVELAPGPPPRPALLAPDVPRASPGVQRWHPNHSRLTAACATRR